jgi:hypothetical protein
LHGVGDILASFANQLDPDARLLEDLAQSGLIGELVFLDMPAWREPHPELAVEMQKCLPLPDYEHSHREVPACLFGTHSVPDYTRPGYTGSQTSITNLHNVGRVVRGLREARS